MQTVDGTVAVKSMNGIEVHIVTTGHLQAEHSDKALIYVHGGGYCYGSPAATYCVSAPVAHRTGLRVYCIDYRLAPEHPFPNGLDDCVTAYQAIIDEVPANKVGVFGESAGGGMALAMVLKAQAKGLAMPAAIACITPCTDLSAPGDTHGTLDGLDPVLSAKMITYTYQAYIGGADPKDPLISPLFAKYSKSFPPTLIQTGTRDLLLSDCVRLHQKMKTAGTAVELSVREGMWHGYHLLPNSEFPEAQAGFNELEDFFRRTLAL